MTEPINLAEKIALARVRLGSLKPDKKNKDQDYMYISADKILERAGDILAEVGIAIIPTVVETVLTNVERPNKSPRIDAVLRLSFQVTDGVKDYTSFWVGCGSDYVTPDKAIYKAITSGHKYFLMKLLNVGVGNEDGEHEDGEPPKPVSDIDKDFPPMPEEPGEPLTPLQEAMNLVTSKGQRYGDLNDHVLHMIIDSEKSPQTRKNAAELILAERAKNQPAA